MFHPASSVQPRFTGPYDARSAIAAAPETGRVRGMFFDMVLSRVEREAGQRLPKTGEYAAFGWYPMREYMEMLVRAAPLLHPGVSLGEGLRRIGWVLYDDFESTMVGKAIFAVAGRKFERLAGLAHKAYDVSYEPASLNASVVGPNRVRVAMDPIWIFPDTYQLGAWEGAARFCRVEPDIRVSVSGPGRVTFDIDYRPVD